MCRLHTFKCPYCDKLGGTKNGMEKRIKSKHF